MSAAATLLARGRCKACWVSAGMVALVVASFWSLDLKWSEFLSPDALLKMARFIGEFSLGFNPYILTPMKDTLTTILATSAVPADLAITYDDMHGLWGGTMITVCGDGSGPLTITPPRLTEAVDAPSGGDTLDLRRELDGRQELRRA